MITYNCVFLLNFGVFIEVKMKYNPKATSEEELDVVAEEFADKIGGIFMYKTNL